MNKELIRRSVLLGLYLKFCVFGKGSFISPIAFFSTLHSCSIAFTHCTIFYALLPLQWTQLFVCSYCTLCTIIIIIIIIIIIRNRAKKWKHHKRIRSQSSTELHPQPTVVSRCQIAELQYTPTPLSICRHLIHSKMIRTRCQTFKRK